MGDSRSGPGRRAGFRHNLASRRRLLAAFAERRWFVGLHAAAEHGYGYHDARGNRFLGSRARSTADAALQRDIDAAIARAWNWHDARFSVEQLGQRSSWQFYALQALGLAASLTEHRPIGDSVWRGQARPVLLKLQDASDGSWQGTPDEPPLIATSMAILFLTSSPTRDNSTSRNAAPKAQPDFVWGPPTRGLQAAVEFVPQQESYAFGDVLGVRFHIRNVSDQTIRFSSELARQGDHPTVLNKAGHEQRVAGVENIIRPQLFPFSVKPGQEAVLDAYPLGIYETEEQGRRFKHTAGNYLVCAPGHYTIRYTVNLGNVVHRDADGKQIEPAEGDWVGTVDTGPVPLEVRRQADGSLPSVRATEAEKPPAVAAAVAEEAIVQSEAIEHKAHLDETARLLEQQAGGIWRKDTLGKRLFCRTIWNDGPRDGTVGLYVVLPGSLDDAGKARAFVEVNRSAIPLDVLGCNDSLTVLASAPEKTPEFTAKIRAALKLEDPGFRINPLRNDESRPQAAKLHGITTDIEQLRLDVLLFFYPGNDSPQLAMTLSVPKLTEESTAEWPKINITKDEAQKLLDAIHEAISFGPRSAYLAGQKRDPLNRFTLVLRGYLKGVDQYEDLEAHQPENRAKMLRAVRGGLTGKAAEAMDELLARIAEVEKARRAAAK